MDKFLIMADAEFALRLEPDSKELKEQYATIKEMWIQKALPEHV